MLWSSPYRELRQRRALGQALYFAVGDRISGSHDGVARHSSQLNKYGFEGILLFALLAWLFWRTFFRHSPGKLVGVFLAGYGVARFTAEFFREPDAQLVHFAAVTGLHMGQWLTMPMVAVGIYLLLRVPTPAASNK